MLMSRTASTPGRSSQPPQRRQRGFETAAALLARRIGSVGEKRGFSAARLLTDWADVVGDEIAARCRPVRVSHRKGAFGATLVLLTTGAEALRLEMDLPRIRERVNACYGFNAIARITLTQTAADGFREGQAVFAAAPATRGPAAAKPADQRRASEAAADAARGVDDPALAAALGRFAYLYRSRRDSQKRGST